MDTKKETQVPEKTGDFISFLKTLFPDSEVTDALLKGDQNLALRAAAKVELIREMEDIWNEQNPPAQVPTQRRGSRSVSSGK